jgi:glycogen synthase
MPGPAGNEPPMRLMIYTHSFAPRVGGVETVAMTLAEGLARTSEADEPRTVAGTRPGGRASPSTEGKARIEVTVVTPTPAGEMDDGALAFRVVRQPGFLELFRLLREADLVHLAGPTLVPLALCLLLRKPVVIEHHGYQAVCPNGLLFYEPTKTLCPGHFMAGRHRECLRCNATQGRLRSLRMWLATFPRRWLSRQAAGNVAISAHVAQRLALPRSRVIYYGTEEGPPAQEQTVGQSDEICFAYAGRLVSEKGLLLLIEAAGRLRAEGRKFRLRFVGDGPERERLEQAARALGIEHRTTTTGMLAGEALQRALGDVSALVMPSIWEETAGLAAIEQMMRGRLVIAADIGGLGEVIGDAGLKFNPGDVDGLCACLRRVLDHPDIAREYGAKARERARNLFRCDRMVEEHWQLYRKVAGEL